MNITYELSEAGWATATISDNKRNVSIEVSYLHDSLKQLIDAAINLKKGTKAESVVFMDEPGEYHLVLNDNDKSFSLRQYNDWASWDMYPIDDFKEILKGKLETDVFIKQVLELSDKIFIKYGLDGYKENWVEHEFPYNQYMKLKRETNT